MSNCPIQDSGRSERTIGSLSVCMIVRDEAKVLRRCLGSLKGIYTELCVVDTGSSDSTIDIAKEYGARVQKFTECNGNNAMAGEQYGHNPNHADS